MRLPWKHALLLLFFVALLPRLAVVAWRWPTPAEILTPLNDSTDYDFLARSLLEGKGFSAPCGQPTAFRPPLYPLFLAAVYAVFGLTNLGAVAILQAFFGASHAVLLTLLARRAGLRERTALLAGLVAALYPPFLFQTPQILAEVLHRFLQTASLLLLLIGLQDRKPLRVAAAGAMFALAALNKSVLLAAFPFLLVWIFLQTRKWYRVPEPKENPDQVLRRTWRAAILFTLPVVVLLGGWTLRNAAASGTFIPVSTNFPITFAHGVTRFSLYTRLWYGEDRCMTAPADYQELTQLRTYCGVEEELAVGRAEAARARRFIAERPWRFAVLTVRKALHFWGANIRNTRVNEWIALLTMGPVLLAGWIGLVVVFFRRHSSMAFALLALAIALPVTVPYAISQCDVRYRLSLIDPLWIILAAGLLDFLLFRWSKSRCP